MFRPCIDLHNGQVKQIVGGTLDDSESPDTNFVSENDSAYYAELYRKDSLSGGHVIKLGPGNDEAAKNALKAWPGGLQIGGGINDQNARFWLDQGASHLIVTSHVFSNGQFDQGKLDELVKITGKGKLILDLSCRIRDGKYWIVTDRWTKFTETELNEKSLDFFSQYCDEFLIHAVDVEGMCKGVDMNLVELLTDKSPLISTYAGGAKSLDDLEKITNLSQNRVHLTIGSALDIFGGKDIKYTEALAFNNQYESSL
ncbi:phosphoribosylformimino-5-aminoimidazole carboxamide ribotide isomerase [Lentisphaera araneosa HTCC2155]|uniref:Phosphoribosylformimino-5-aminoimidazole carboxamide ribotide isomerase n=1 Tax=Lentisphaera araneosa HTCC2155 TaxID=313628 RepID=A6DFV7_9BACT|nr:phosphoribosylformimino-5-aminoimidazole carboxamide ribotide isomerase [Lentisphaera araneosa]EDM29687.1 phosphoribosylformimino-5-aminoimidazole carboxamide ribotide isomerase [Lentisphaera araneosa HTCC2155]